MQSNIYSLSLETAVGDESATNLVISAESQEGGGKKQIHPIEQCKCPPNFEGNSCERCAKGFRRVNNQLYDGLCKRCECQVMRRNIEPNHMAG